MKKVVFCEVAWMKYYQGVVDDDKPMQGGKYITENGEGGEVYNFMPYNHKCYGYVMHYGDELHIERYDKVLKSSDEVHDMTVVWVASDRKSSKIVGWYEHATMYRYWHSFYDPMICGDSNNDHNFIADEKDCYLLDENQRTFIIPRAPKVGKGKGMGQSQVWYADSEYAQNEFVPKVLEYLDSVRDTCKPFYASKEELSECAEDHNESTDELIKKTFDEYKKRDRNLRKAFSYVNLAVEKDDCYQTRFCRAECYSNISFYDEAEEDYKYALHYEENMESLEPLMYVELMLHNTFLAIEIGEKIRKRKMESKEWENIACNLAHTYIDEGEFDEARILIKECKNESNGVIHESWIPGAEGRLNDVANGM